MQQSEFREELQEIREELRQIKRKIEQEPVKKGGAASMVLFFDRVLFDLSVDHGLCRWASQV